MSLASAVLFLPLLSIQHKAVLPPFNNTVVRLNPCFNNSSTLTSQSHGRLFTGSKRTLCKKPTPYCDFSTNDCVKDPPDLDFKCEVDGVFPFANGCSGFYNCSQKEMTRQECPEGSSFDYKKNVCTKKKFCRLPRCKGKNGVYVKHPAHKSLVVLCTGGQPSSVLVCPEDYVFSKGSVPPCNFICKRAGYFPAIQSRQFYNCTRVAGKLRPTIHFCPLGQEFQQKDDGASFQCVPGNNFSEETSSPPNQYSTHSGSTTLPITNQCSHPSPAHAPSEMPHSPTSQHPSEMPHSPTSQHPSEIPHPSTAQPRYEVSDPPTNVRPTAIHHEVISHPPQTIRS